MRRVLSLIDTSVVGTRSAVELAALGPGTMLCDYSAYIFTFLAIASAQALGSRPSMCHSMAATVFSAESHKPCDWLSQAGH